MRIWKRSAGSSYKYRKAIVALERLSTELRSTYNYAPVGFAADNHFITFANINRDKIFNITYNFSEANMSLLRTTMTRQQMLRLDNTTPRASIVIPHLKKFSFSFWASDPDTHNLTFVDGAKWNVTASGIPSAVKISVTLDDDTLLEKIVNIPIAS